jgi:hypothetical protein
MMRDLIATGYWRPLVDVATGALALIVVVLIRELISLGRRVTRLEAFLEASEGYDPVNRGSP